jgi:uncharacterized protein YaaN involved in tellurite resistance
MAQKEKISQRVLLELLTEEIEELKKSNKTVNDSLSKNLEYIQQMEEYIKALEEERERITNTKIKINTHEFDQLFDKKLSKLKNTLSENAVFPAWGTVFFVIMLLYGIAITLLHLNIF